MHSGFVDGIVQYPFAVRQIAGPLHVLFRTVSAEHSSQLSPQPGSTVDSKHWSWWMELQRQINVSAELNY